MAGTGPSGMRSVELLSCMNWIQRRVQRLWRSRLSKLLLWDIESTGLKGDFATILCIGYKWYGERTTKVISIMDFPRFKKDPTDAVSYTHLTLPTSDLV